MTQPHGCSAAEMVLDQSLGIVKPTASTWGTLHLTPSHITLHPTLFRSPSLVARENTALAGGLLRAWGLPWLTHGVRGVGDDDVEGILVLFHELKAITHVEGQLRARITDGHTRQKLLRDFNDILGRGTGGTVLGLRLGTPG